jgi:myo-inositol-1(or 4)-monophosphatase
MELKIVAIKAAKTAGNILKSEFFRPQNVKGKTKHDVVSDADYKSEKTIIKIIKDNFPEHNIIAEESGNEHKKSEFSWYIDPLDGTSNFVIGNPYFSVSIALAKNNEVILGVVFNPILNELYIAEKGKGALLNNKSISVSSTQIMSDSFIASAYSSDEKNIKKGLKVIERLALNSRKVVINFSPALNLCNIARGRIEALVDNGTTPEDHAAGSLIVMEAGGKIQNYDSKTWNINKIGIIASNGKIHNNILKLI